MNNFKSNVVHAAKRSRRQGKSSEHGASLRVRRLLAIGFKLAISFTALYYIYHRVQEESLAFTQIMNSVELLPLFQAFLLFIASILCMGFNWGIEVYKWHLLIGPRLGTFWKTAVKGVLTGTTFGVFTPNRIGEFIGKTLALHPDYRVSGVVLSMINGVSQTMATLTFGIIGFLYLVEILAIESLGFLGVRILQMMLIALWLLSMFIYFNINRVTEWLRNISILNQYKNQLELAGGLSTRLLNSLYIYSLIRFSSFILQYCIVFSVLVENPNWVEIAGISMVSLFSSTVLSFIPVPDVLIKQAVALSFFSLVQFDLTIAATGVFAVWLVNVAVPAIIGAIILYSYRIFKPA